MDMAEEPGEGGTQADSRSPLPSRACEGNVAKLRTQTALTTPPSVRRCCSGVRDDNTARDGVVQKFFKEADSIWIVSHINRAINDKTAKV